MSVYSVVIWDNAGARTEVQAGDDLVQAKAAAKAHRVLANRTVKIASAGNAIFHWTRTTNLTRNHWSQRQTADEWFV